MFVVGKVKMAAALTSGHQIWSALHGPQRSDSHCRDTTWTGNEWTCCQLQKKHMRAISEKIQTAFRNNNVVCCIFFCQVD